MNALIISTITPERKYASWVYVDSMVQVISKYMKTRYWFSLLIDKPHLIPQDNSVINIIEKSQSLLTLLKIKSLSSNHYFAHNYHRKHLDSLRKTLKDFPPSIVIFANLPSASYFFDMKKLKPDIYTVLIQHNVEYIVMKDMSKYGKSTFHRAYYALQKNLVKNFEREIMAKVDLIISISPSDKEYFVKNYGIPADKIEVIRPIFEYEKNLFKSYPSEEKLISFISSFNWYPNIEGAVFFVRSVLPRLLEKFPKLKLYLVGRDPEKKVYELQEKYPENIVITGTVKNVEDYYRISDCVVIPVFIGPGIKLKVLEAMASGVPTVMTSYVAKDYDLLDKGFCIADTPEEFVHHIERLLTDYDYARTISKRQIGWYENYILNERENLEAVLRRILLEIMKRK